MSRLRRFVSTLLAAGIVLSCDSPSEVAGTTGSLALTLSLSEASLAQGSSLDIGVTVARTNTEGPVSLSTNALPAGVEVSFQPDTIAADATTSKATVSVSSFTAPSTFEIELVAKGARAATAATLAITVGVKGTYSLGLLHPTIAVAQGGAGGTTVLVSRANAFPGIVSLSVAGLPAGVTASFDTARADRSFAELFFTATPSAATGSHAITITGKTIGLADQTTTLTVDVIPPPPTSNVTLRYCPGQAPAWFGYRNEGYGWKRAFAVGDSITISATERLVYAEHYSPTSSGTWVYHLARAELASQTLNCAGSRTLQGSAVGLASADRATVAMASSVATALPTSSNYTLTQVPSGPRDLLAIRRSNTFPYAADKVIVRRAVDIANAGTIPVLDFASEGFVPVTSTLTVTGLNGDDTTTPVQSALITPTSFLTLQARSSAASVPLVTLPAAQMSAGDMHQLYVEGTRVVGDLFTGPVIGRIHMARYTTVGDRIAALPPDLRTPSFSVIGAAPSLRVRALLPSQAEYPTRVYYELYGGSKFVSITVTAAYLGGTPATWDVSIPHFGTVEGYSNGWGLEYLTDYYVHAQSGPSFDFYDVHPRQPYVITVGYRYEYLTLRVNATPSAGDEAAIGPRVRPDRIWPRERIAGFGRIR